MKDELLTLLSILYSSVIYEHMKAYATNLIHILDLACNKNEDSCGPVIFRFSFVTAQQLFQRVHFMVYSLLSKRVFHLMLLNRIQACHEFIKNHAQLS